MAFQRMEGFAGSVPQGFIDGRVKVCPFCGSVYPHWAIDQKMQMSLEGNLYLFQCEQCKGVLSATVPDVTGFNNTVLTTTGLLKKMSGKENGVIYLRVHDAGNNADFANKVGTEYTLEEINQMAEQKTRTPVAANTTPDSFGETPASAVYADQEVYTIKPTPVAEPEPMYKIKPIDEREEQTAREAERRKKQCRIIMFFALASMVSVVLSLVFFASNTHRSAAVVFNQLQARYILAFIPPCICLLAAFRAKKKPGIIKFALIICIAFFALQIGVALLYALTITGAGDLPVELIRFANKLARYVNGFDFGVYFYNILRMFGKASGKLMEQQLTHIAPGFFAVLPNILCTTILAIYCKKMK